MAMTIVLPGTWLLGQTMLVERVTKMELTAPGVDELCVRFLMLKPPISSGAALPRAPRIWRRKTAIDPLSSMLIAGEACIAAWLRTSNDRIYGKCGSRNELNRSTRLSVSAAEDQSAANCTPQRNSLHCGSGVEVAMTGVVAIGGVVDGGDDVAGVLPPLVPDADVLPMLPSAVVVSAPAPAVLEVLPVGYGVELDDVGAGVLEEDIDVVDVFTLHKTSEALITMGPDGVSVPDRPDSVMRDCMSYILDSRPIVTVIVLREAG